MNSEKWIEHLAHWRMFLEERLAVIDDDGEREKTTRQISAIERVRHSAVLNPKLLIEFINPTNEPISQVKDNLQFCLELNDSQKEAVNTAVNGTQYLSLIQGPPGTGKTQVISEICLQLYYRNPAVKILVCSETHVAVNNLITRIAEYDPTIKCLRIRDKEKNSEADAYSPSAVIGSYQTWLQEVCTDSDIVNAIVEMLPEYENRGLEKALALSSNVVGMTCNRIGAYRFMDTTEMFDYVIIDEVCKATLPEILMPLTIAKKAVLVGDPKQLPPVFCSEDREIIRNIEHCELQRYMYIDELFDRSCNTIILDTQYRMEKSVGTLISNLFYSDTLKNGRDAEIEDSLLWVDYLPTQMWPENPGEDDTPIIRNLDECSIIRTILDGVDSKQTEEKSIAIIAPYRQQIFELRKAIPEYNNIKVSIDTVDGFQGKEADIVVFGITRTTGSFRFLADSRRLNVALSRARDQIIIVGNAEYAVQHKLLERILSRCKTIKV